MSTPTSDKKTWLNGLLFGLTVLTLGWAGTMWGDHFVHAGTLFDWDPLASLVRALHDPRLLFLGVLYAAVLMIILVGHELGHYLTCRRYGIRATLPFFLPGPPFLGTFGAFIRIKSPMYFKRQVFDVGANGPLAGFALTLPALAVGLALSKVAPAELTFRFGLPLILKIICPLFFGPIPEGSILVLHPVGWAGWVGLLVTALNLLPIGQLDGGHIAYAVLGRRARRLSRVMIGLLAVMGVFFHVTWLVLAAIILVFEIRTKMSFTHPPVIDEAAPLGRKRTVLGIAVLVIFVLAFVPEPAGGVSLLDFIKGIAGPF